MRIEILQRQAAELGKQVVSQRADRPIGHQIRTKSGQPVEKATRSRHNPDQDKKPEQSAPIRRTSVRHNEIDGLPDQLGGNQNPRIAQDGAKEDTS